MVTRVSTRGLNEARERRKTRRLIDDRERKILNDRSNKQDNYSKVREWLPNPRLSRLHLIFNVRLEHSRNQIF